MKNVIAFILTVCFLMNSDVLAQSWHGKKCAVVLTYDDALDGHLDYVIPELNAAKLKGTFYLIGSSSVVDKRINDWRRAAKRGHELGNHSLNHPCDGTLPGRSFVTREGDLTKYSVERALKEIRIASTMLKAIDGKERRTFAYPCGDLTIAGVPFFSALQGEFEGARGVIGKLATAGDIDINNIYAFSQHNSTGEQMIAQVKQAEREGALLVFLFHGVGGGHNLNVSAEEHAKLLTYLRANRRNIWVAPMVDVAAVIKESKKP